MRGYYRTLKRIFRNSFCNRLFLFSSSTVDHILRFCEPEPETAPVEDVVMTEPGSGLNSGTLVAALTLTAEGSEEWILARICGFSGGKYQIEDAEVEGEPEEKE